MKVLVCGGAGYIGSHMVKHLADHGHKVVTYDNLSSGHKDAVLAGPLVISDLLDEEKLDQTFKTHGPFDLVMHFGAKSVIPESVEQPVLYFENNVTGTKNLLEAMRRHGTNKIVFSSTAAVYGIPVSTNIDESHPCKPINPYGESKLLAERMLEQYHRDYGIRSVSFRYFNAAGAHPDAVLGERHDPETHLIPNILFSLLGKGTQLKVFGDDYDTPDGSCVRDYIHICDICDAHLAAATYLDLHDGSHIMNLGNEKGFSVFQIIESARRVTNKVVEFTVEDRRPGDSATLVASATLAIEEINWKPAFPDIEEIIESAWRFYLGHPRYVR